MLHQDERRYLVKLARLKLADGPARPGAPAYPSAQQLQQFDPASNPYAPVRAAPALPAPAAAPRQDLTSRPRPSGGLSFATRALNALDRNPISQYMQDSRIGRATYDNPGTAAAIAIPAAAAALGAAPTVPLAAAWGAGSALLGDGITRAVQPTREAHGMAPQALPTVAQSARTVALGGLGGAGGLLGGRALEAGANILGRSGALQTGGAAVSEEAVPAFTRALTRGARWFTGESAGVGKAGEEAGEAAGGSLSRTLAHAAHPASELAVEHGVAAPALETAFGGESALPPRVAQTPTVTPLPTAGQPKPQGQNWAGTPTVTPLPTAGQPKPMGQSWAGSPQQRQQNTFYGATATSNAGTGMSVPPPPKPQQSLVSDASAPQGTAPQGRKSTITPS